MFDRVTNDILCDKVLSTQTLLMKPYKVWLIKDEKNTSNYQVDYVSVGNLNRWHIKAPRQWIPFNENLIIKIEDIDTCEITIENY
jgi:LacI family transcriptional regulator